MQAYKACAPSVSAGLVIGLLLGAAPAVAQAPAVGTLVLDAPLEQEFVLHGTLPVPAGTYRPGDVDVPLTVLDTDGSPAPTQVEVTSRYPAPDDGADVVEILARVHRPADVAPGEPMKFTVVHESQPRGQAQPGAHVAALLADPEALALRARDVFGHLYEAPLARALAEPGVGRARRGKLVHEDRVHRPMLPVIPAAGPQGTLPHLLGVHAWVRTVDREDYLLLDLHLHNGFDGLDREDPADDALVELYLRHLELRLPAGWRVLHAFPSPAVGQQPAVDGTWRDHRLLEDQRDGSLYYVPRQAHFVRRLAVAHESAVERARAALALEHLALSQRGRNPDGTTRWSWWNRKTGRYFPQRFALPKLDHVGLEGLRAGIEAELAKRTEQVALGRGGVYPLYSGRLGWAQPWGVQYGGMTGGDEIVVVDGVRTAASLSQAGVRLAQLAMRLYVDRQPTALVHANGRPTRVGDILYKGPGGPYTTSTFFLVPKSGDPFGFDDAPTFQTDAVKAQGRDPWWEEDLAAFQPIDFQHYIRYVRNLKTLAWLANDSLAKHELQAAAEVFRLSFHQFPFDKWGYVEANGLLHRMQRAQEDPGEGLPIGRGEAWGLDAAAAAYSVADDEYRERTRPWLELVAHTFRAGQSRCSGNLMALHVGKLLDGRYLVRRANESSYLENALRGVNESAFRGLDAELAGELDALVVGSVRAGLTAPFWDEAQGGSWWTVGVSPVDWSLPEFCDRYPDGAFEGGVTGEHLWVGIAYAYHVTGDPFFLGRASKLVGGVDLWQWLHDGGLDNVEGRAAALALVQSLYESTR